jgi:predicted RNase H-like HicB family nuclease
MAKTRVEQKSFSVYITIERAPDLPGQWEAQCLEVDVITYGNSPQDALRMIEEATALCIVDDLDHDRDPLAHEAPDEDWTRLRNLLGEAKKVPVDTLESKPPSGAIFVLTMRLKFSREIEVAGPAIDLPGWMAKKEVVLGMDRITAVA